MISRRSSFRPALTAGLALLVVVASGESARADITGHTVVDLYQGDRMLDSRTYWELYRGRNMYSDVDGNAWEQLVNAAKVASDLYGIATGESVLSVVKDGYGLYHDVQALADSWGGRTEYREGLFVVGYPHTQYDRIKVSFYAGSNDNPLLIPTAAPRANGVVAGLSRTPVWLRSDRRSSNVTYTFDLKAYTDQMGQAPIGVIPFVFAVQEDPGSTWISNSKIVHVMKIVIVRLPQAPPMATTNVSYRYRYPWGDVPASVARSQLMSYAPAAGTFGHELGEPSQVATVRVHKRSGGRCYLNGQEYNELVLWMDLRSPRPQANHRPAITLATQLVGPWPVGLQPGTVQVSRGREIDQQGLSYPSEGNGYLQLVVNVQQLQPGTMSVWFIANQGNWWFTWQRVDLVVTADPVLFRPGGWN